MVLYVRIISEEEWKQLRKWLERSAEDLRHRAEVVVLSNRGYTIPEIARKTGYNPANLRKWVRRFNDYGVEGLKTHHHGGPRITFKPVQRQAIVRLAREGDNGRTWTLHGLAKAAAEQGIVESISHEWVRQILKEAGITLCRRS